MLKRKELEKQREDLEKIYSLLDSKDESNNIMAFQLLKAIDCSIEDFCNFIYDKFFIIDGLCIGYHYIFDYTIYFKYYEEEEKYGIYYGKDYALIFAERYNICKEDLCEYINIVIKEIILLKTNK